MNRLDGDVLKLLEDHIWNQSDDADEAMLSALTDEIETMRNRLRHASQHGLNLDAWPEIRELIENE